MVTLRSTLIRGAALLAGALAASSCGDDPVAPPGPGTMVVRLAGAPEHLGIVTIRLRGAIDGEIQHAPEFDWWERSEDGARVILVSGPLDAGILATFPSPDRRGGYRVEALSAAADSSGGYAVLDPDRIRLRVEPE